MPFTGNVSVLHSYLHKGIQCFIERAHPPVKLSVLGRQLPVLNTRLISRGGREGVMTSTLHGLSCSVVSPEGEHISSLNCSTVSNYIRTRTGGGEGGRGRKGRGRKGRRGGERGTGRKGRGGKGEGEKGRNMSSKGEL